MLIKTDRFSQWGNLIFFSYTSSALLSLKVQLFDSYFLESLVRHIAPPRFDVFLCSVESDTVNVPSLLYIAPPPSFAKPLFKVMFLILIFLPVHLKIRVFFAHQL